MMTLLSVKFSSLLILVVFCLVEVKASPAPGGSGGLDCGGFCKAGSGNSRKWADNQVVRSYSSKSRSTQNKQKKYSTGESSSSTAKQEEESAKQEEGNAKQEEESGQWFVNAHGEFELRSPEVTRKPQNLHYDKDYLEWYDTKYGGMPHLKPLQATWTNDDVGLSEAQVEQGLRQNEYRNHLEEERSVQEENANHYQNHYHY